MRMQPGFFVTQRGRLAMRRGLLALFLMAPTRIQALSPSRQAQPPTSPIREVEVNQASLEDLRSIPGIGPARARRIVQERAHGPFRDLADLSARVPGLGPAAVRQLARNGLRVNTR